MFIINLKNYFNTISHDELANIAPFIHKPTLITLLTKKNNSLFYQITPLLLNKLRVWEDLQDTLDIEQCTLNIIYNSDFHILRDMVHVLGVH